MSTSAEDLSQRDEHIILKLLLTAGDKNPVKLAEGRGDGGVM